MKVLFITSLVVLIFIGSTITYVISAGQKENPEPQPKNDGTDTINKNKYSYWAHSYGSADFKGEGVAIQQTTDGGYIIAGTIIFDEESTWLDFWVIKLHSNGTIAWQKAYGGKGYDRCTAIQQTTDGGYIVVGSTFSFGFADGNIWVLKLRNDGTIAWQKTYGGNGWEYEGSIQQTTDGGYILSGCTNSFGNGDEDILVLKLNADGNVEWQRAYCGDGRDWPKLIRQTSDGGYILIGKTDLGNRGGDIWVVKLDKNGQIIWQKAYGGFGDEYAGSIQQTSDGGYIVCGYSSPDKFEGTAYDIWVLKLKSDGVVEWEKSYGGDKGDTAASIQQTPDGGYMVAGITGSFGNGSGDIWVLKLRNDGNIAWQKTYGGKRHDAVIHIQQIHEGYIMIGTVKDLDRELKGADKVLVLKIDKDGLIPSIPSLGIDTKVIPQKPEYFQPQWSGISTEDMKRRRYYTYSDTRAHSRSVDVSITDTQVKPIDTKAIIMEWPNR